MNLELHVDDSFWDELTKKLGEAKTEKVIKDALVLLNWAAAEAQKGRVIISVNADGEEVKELAMPALEKVKRK